MQRNFDYARSRRDIDAQRTRQHRRAPAGALPAVVTAYGSVAPSEIGTRTFNEAQPGQVTRLFVSPAAR
jgi:hypothetical protein